MWLPPIDQALPASPPFSIKVCGNRNPDDLRQLTRQFQLETALRYERGLLNGKPSPLARSWCNLATSDITAAAGCPVPRSIHGRFLTANDQFDWLLIAGPADGWERIELERAQIEVERGLIIVAAWRNPNPDESGHIAVGQPAPRGPDGQLWIAQAGYRNFSSGTLRSGFGKDKVPHLWFHP